MAFSFGAAAQQPQQQQAPSLFGNTAAASTSAPSPFGSFGQPAAAATPSSLFGQPAAAAQQQPATTGLYGTTAPQPAGGLFGSAPAAPAAGSGLFGSTSAAPAAAPATGGLFGSAPAAAPAAGGGLFGSAPAAAPAGGSIFGAQAQQPAATSSLFGAPKPATSSLFGAAPAAAPAAGGGLFGSTSAAPAAGSSLFGSTAAQPAGGLFGGSTAQPAQPAGSMFGSAAQPAAAPALFGSTAQQQPQQNMFASTSNNPLAASTVKQQQDPDIESRIVAIKNAWDVNSPECRFKYYFYNFVEPGTAQFYGRPAGATDEAKWARAVRDNPDPNCMVPVLATGWADVKKRVQAQEQTASVHQQRVKELNEALSNLSRQTALDSSVRLSALQTHLTQLTQRLLHLAAQSPSFTGMQNSAFRPEEGEMKHTLEGVKDALDGRARPPPKGSVGLSSRPHAASKGRMLGQVNELWGAVEEVRRQHRGRSENASWAGDEKLLTEIATVLEQQQAAITRLGELANDAVFDADVMRQGLGMVDSRKQ